MFDHVTIRVSDRGGSERFYKTVLGSIGIEKTGSAGEFGDDCPEFAEWDDFSLAPVDAEHPVTTGLHVGFRASSRDEVEHFWRTGVDAGYRDDGAPGPRPQYGDDYYGAFLLDPDGNSVEAVIHGGVRAPGTIDHVWIRVPDLAATTAFYESISEFTGFEPRARRPERAHFQGRSASFALVDDDGPPTRNLHLAFSARSNETVNAFHGVALAAGYRDNGAPGERPHYHAGYYAAFVLDPAGNNVELVNHNRP